MRQWWTAIDSSGPLNKVQFLLPAIKDLSHFVQEYGGLYRFGDKVKSPAESFLKVCHVKGITTCE